MFDIDIRLLLHYGITAHQYVILRLLHEQQHGLLNNYLTSIGFKNLEDDKSFLVETGFLIRYEYHPTVDIRGYKLTDKSVEMLSTGSTDYFDDFLQEFPDKIVRGSVTDFLKSDLTRSRRKYLLITKGKKHLHEHILKCLKFEINHRTNTGTMGFFKKLPNWLETEEWKAYELELDNKQNNTVKLGYGTKLE